MRNLKEYHRPKSLPEALALLSRKTIRTVPLAGGTSLVAGRPREIEAVVDLSSLSLDYIRSDADGITLGAMTPLASAFFEPEVRHFAGGLLHEAVLRSATSLQLNQATFGGALLSPRTAGELAAALLVLECEVIIGKADGSSVMPLPALYENIEAGTRGGILLEARITAPPAGVRLGSSRVARSPRSSPILAVASYAPATELARTEYRIAVAGRGRLPMRMPLLEAALAGKHADPVSAQNIAEGFVDSLEFEKDGQESMEYRRAILPVLIRRALSGVLGE